MSPNNTGNLQADYPRDNSKRYRFGEVPKSHPNEQVWPYANKDPKAKQTEDLTVTGATNDKDYTVTINNVDITATSASSGATTDSIATKIKDAIENEPLVTGDVRATVSSSTVTVTAQTGGVPFTISESDGELSLTQTQANATASPIKFGHLLFDNGMSGETRLAKDLNTSDLTKRDLQVTLDGSTDGDYRVTVEYRDGKRFTAVYSASAKNKDEILNNLQTDFANNGPDEISASVDTGPSPSELHLKSETAGFGDFKIMEVDGPSQMNASVVAQGDDLNKVLAGVARHVNSQAVDTDDSAKDEYDPSTQMSVVKTGFYVAKTEKDVTVTNPVYVRVSDNGNNDEKGIVRDTWESGAVPLSENAAQFDYKRGQQKVDIELTLG